MSELNDGYVEKVLHPLPPREKTESEKRKDCPVYSGFMAYFPDAMMEVARLSKTGNDKHNKDQPLHWSWDKSCDHADCISRHQLEWDKLDDDGHWHATKVAWRAMAQLQRLLVEAGLADLPPGARRDIHSEVPHE